MNTSLEEKILTALFLCSDKPNEILNSLRPEWNEKCKLSLNEKLLIINSSFLISKIFPWKDELSEGIDHEEFCKSFFVQPDLINRQTVRTLAAASAVCAHLESVRAVGGKKRVRSVPRTD